jgi:hypothetical protein
VRRDPPLPLSSLHSLAGPQGPAHFYTADSVLCPIRNVVAQGWSVQCSELHKV